MEEDVHEYEGAEVAVTYDANRCIHVRACVEGLPEVFDADRRPWVAPDAADADAVAAVVERCPTGALQYERLDGAPGEAVPDRNVVTVVEDGPVHLRGDLDLRTVEGEPVLRDTRVAACRCGHSGNLPLCDGSHERVFEAAGVDPASAGSLGDEDGGGDGATDGDDTGVVPDADADEGDGADGRLAVTLRRNGPIHLEGAFTLRRAEATERLEETALCRCGHSPVKPFCDGTHREVGFTTDEGE
jgi:CDGSH-type Zn-finger protein/ferredoxin